MSDSDSTSPSDDAFLRAIAKDSELGPPEEHALGSRVGRFVIERELGRGGMGIVYRARDERLDRVIALKVLGRRREQDAERRARFLREARSAASIVHPNVAAIYEIGEADETLFIAMELVDGVSLRQRLVKDGRLSVAEVVALGTGIARGLAAAQKKQVIHRDLKPENIMVEPSGQPKILDFGLAKLHDADVSPSAFGQQPTRSPSTEDGRILGTPGYMSPEQAAGKALDARSDLFSLGVVLYEAITAKRPFSFETSTEAIAAVLRDAPPPIRRRRPDIPVALADLVMQCLAKTPGSRPADASEIRVRLEALDVRPPRRSRAALVGGAVAVAGLAIVGIGLAMRSPTTPAPASDAGVVDAGPTRGVAMNSFPPPRTNVPAAAAAYAVGLTSLRDGAFETGVQSIFRATKLDPTLAAAQVRVALYATSGGWTVGLLAIDAREAFTLATRLRSSLDERDLALLRIAEAALADPIDWTVYLARAREASARFPGDAEIELHLAGALAAVGKLEESRAQFHHLLELDPGFALALLNLGQWEYLFRRDEQAIALYDRCLALQPAASSCLRGRAEVHEARGECVAVEADARRLVAVDPGSPVGNELLAHALAWRNAPIESVRAALDRMVSLGSDISVFFSASLENYWLALLVGDLSAAEAALLEVDRMTMRETSASFHENIVETLTRIALERGETREAAARYYAGVERLAAARSADAPHLLPTIRLYEQHRAKRIGDAEFEAERQRRYREGEAMYADVAGEINDDRGWIAVFIDPAQTKDELNDALAHLDAHGPLHDEWGLTGRVYLDAGRYDDAIRVLRPATSRCEVMPHTAWALAGTTRWYLEKHRELGEALEGKGDRDGACTAYGVIAARWKNAKPRSVTLEKARDRMRVLNCGR